MKFNLKYIRRLNILVSGGISGFYFYNIAYHLEDFKSALELKINNASAPVAPKIKNLVRDTMNDMGLSSEEKALFQVFISNDCNLKHLGYPDKRLGALLGVPQHFILDKTTQFVIEPMVDNTNLSSNSPEVWNFKNLLTLSKEAKKFAMASEIYEARHIGFYYLGLLPMLVFFKGNMISFFSEKLFKALGKELPSFHAFVFLMAVWVYLLLNDYLIVKREGDAMYLAAKLGPSYVDGGIEYYEKLLERNKALRNLDKSAPYTEEGEIKKYMGFRTCSMPIERRINLLKELKRNYKFPDNKENPTKIPL